MASSKHPSSAIVDGQTITCPDMDSAVRAIIAKSKSGNGFTVFTLNLDHLVKLRRSADFREAYANAAVVTADGAPVAWLARFQDTTVQRTTGADLLEPLAQAAAEARLPVFLFGTSADVMARAGRELAGRTEDLLDIAGTMAPSAAFDPKGPEADQAIARIKSSAAKLVFVALGAPKQEIFAERARAAGLNCGFVCVGAALDFLAGTQIRAPQAMRNSGTEWLWRLASNPKCFVRRYAECAGLMLDLVVLAPLRDRSARPRA